MKNLLVYTFTLLYKAVMNTVTAAVFFMILTMNTQIPVDNNSLWIGVCIIITGLDITASTVLSSNRRKKEKHDG